MSYDFEERAAIYEFDAGFTREHAEAMAYMEAQSVATILEDREERRAEYERRPMDGKERGRAALAEMKRRLK